MAIARACCFAFPCLAACAVPSGERAELTQSSVVYGLDDRIELYQVHSAPLQRLMRASLVAVISPDHLDESDPNDVQVLGPSLQEVNGLCDGEPFANQPAVATCSGILVDRDLVLTAGHCFADESDCRRQRLVFGYGYEGPGQLATITSDDVHRCRSLVVHYVDVDPYEGEDYAFVQLDRPATELRTPAPVNLAGKGVDPGAALLAIGFGSGLPAKLDSGVRTLEVGAGPAGTFRATVDAFAGGSGMALLNTDLEVVGSLIRGELDYVRNGTCWVVNRLEQSCADCVLGGELVNDVRSPIRDLCAAGWPSLLLCGHAARCGDGLCSGEETLERCSADCDEQAPDTDLTAIRDGDEQGAGGVRGVSLPAASPAVERERASPERAASRTALCSHAAPSPPHALAWKAVVLGGLIGLGRRRVPIRYNGSR